MPINFPFGLTGGPDLHLCNADGVQDKILKLDDSGNLLLDGVRIGDSAPLIQAQSGSALSSMDFTSGLTSAYGTLVLHLFDWEPVTDGAALETVLSTDAGSTWAEAAGSYMWVHGEVRAGNATRSGSDSATLMQIVNAAVSNVAGEGASGTIVFHGTKSATARCSMEWIFGHVSTDVKAYQTHGFGRRLADEDITGIRLRASTGNMACTAELYGIMDT